MYSNWTVKQLKDELKTRGGTLKGRKADLVSRLESFDRNCNFGIPQDHDTDDIQIDLPTSESYRDINSSTILPPLTRQHIRLYFAEHDKRPDEGLRLYEARFLIIIRAAFIGEHTFIKGICKASIKRIQYEVNLKLHNEAGTIEETSCECVAGSGVAAHCKHVAITLFAVEHMVREKIILKHQTPTEKLQKFHAPRSVFTSTPIKSCRLPMKRKIDNVIFSPCSMTVDKNEYDKKFRSLILNYPYKSSMPIKQLYEPANPYAIEVDHCYDKISSREKLLSNLTLTSISAEKAATIELETRGQSSNIKWETERKCRITASNFHTICHLREKNQEKFAEQLLIRKKITSKSINHGIINETSALQKYMEGTDLQVIQCGLFVSKERPYLAASPDGILGDESVIEIKCPYSTRNQMITPNTVPYLVLGENGELVLKKTSPYYYQVQGQLYCSEKKYCNFIVYTYKDLKVIYITRDNTFIAEMLKKLDVFYENHYKKALFNKYMYRNYLDIIKKLNF